MYKAFVGVSAHASNSSNSPIQSAPGGTPAPVSTTGNQPTMSNRESKRGLREAYARTRGAQGGGTWSSVIYVQVLKGSATSSNQPQPYSPSQATQAAIATQAIQASVLPPAADTAYESGLQFMKLGDLITAAGFFQEAAELGHLDAQLKLGALHSHEDTVFADPTKSEYWYKKAGEQGSAKACEVLGILYRSEMKNDEAFYWNEKGAQLGNPECQYRLGLAYHYGHGVTADEPQSQYWLKQAEAQGCNIDPVKRFKEKYSFTF